MKVIKVLLVKCSNVALAFIAVIALIFANCQCMGRAYEAELPEELN